MLLSVDMEFTAVAVGFRGTGWGERVEQWRHFESSMKCLVLKR